MALASVLWLTGCPPVTDTTADTKADDVPVTDDTTTDTAPCTDCGSGG